MSGSDTHEGTTPGGMLGLVAMTWTGIAAFHSAGSSTPSMTTALAVGRAIIRCVPASADFWPARSAAARQSSSGDTVWWPTWSGPPEAPPYYGLVSKSYIGVW